MDPKDSGCDLTEAELLELLKASSRNSDSRFTESGADAPPLPPPPPTPPVEAPPAPVEAPPAPVEAPPASDVPPPADAPDAAEGPLDERLRSRDWKVRREAYIELKARFEADDADAFAEFAGALDGAAREASAGALDAALDAIGAYIERVTPQSAVGASARQLASLVIENGLAARPGSARKASDVLLRWVECDAPTIVVGALLEGLKHKKPKVPPACAECLTACLQAFGRAEFPVSDVAPRLQPLFDSTSAPLRKAATTLVVELHRWFGDAITSPSGPLKDLKAAARKDVDARIEQLKSGGEGQPTLREFIGLRSARARAADDGGAGGAATRADPPVSGVSEWDLAEDVDLIAKLKTKPFAASADGLHADKWAERKQALELVLDAIGPVPKLRTPDETTKPAMAELVKSARTLSADSHQAVAGAAVKVIGALASGLRAAFAPWALASFRALVARAKDKKAIAGVTTALDALVPYALKLDERVRVGAFPPPRTRALSS